MLNRTNGECLKAMFGRDTGEWIGKRVTLYPAEYQGETAIRVKGSPDMTEVLEKQREEHEREFGSAFVESEEYGVCARAKSYKGINDMAQLSSHRARVANERRKQHVI